MGLLTVLKYFWIAVGITFAFRSAWSQRKYLTLYRESGVVPYFPFKFLEIQREYLLHPVRFFTEMPQVFGRNFEAVWSSQQATPALTTAAHQARFRFGVLVIWIFSLPFWLVLVELIRD